MRANPLCQDMSVQFIPQDQHRFTTIGDWWEDEHDVLQVRISIMNDFRFQVAVLFHELIEFFVCKRLGITTEECDAWDEHFEGLYRTGERERSEEAGFDRDCPYRKAHVWGARFERLVIFILGASWKKYIRECDGLMEIRSEGTAP